MNFQKNFDTILKNYRLLALYTVNKLEELSRVEHILIKSNLPLIEIPLRSEQALNAIKILSSSGKLQVGAGTVRTVKEVQEAIECGANFIVCPAVIEDVIEFCLDKKIPIYPGITTPSELQKVWEYCLKVVKFFPAEIYGGCKAISALSGPYFDMSFLPTGGIDDKNYKEYLELKEVICVGGSFIISEKILNTMDDQNIIKYIEKLLNV